MVFSLLRNTITIVTRKDKVNLSQGLALNTKNARAESAIQTIMYMAQTFMVHASLHWTDRGSDDLSLC